MFFFGGGVVLQSLVPGPFSASGYAVGGMPLALAHRMTLFLFAVLGVSIILMRAERKKGSGCIFLISFLDALPTAISIVEQNYGVTFIVSTCMCHCIIFSQVINLCNLLVQSLPIGRPARYVVN